MAGKSESNQLAIASAAVAALVNLADSTKDVPKPSDSFVLLEKLSVAQQSLSRIYAQLSAWHSQVEHGVHHGGEGEGSIPENPAWVRAELALGEAAALSDSAVEAVNRAHSANGVARWYEEIVTDPG